MNIWNNQNEELHTFNQRKDLIASRIKGERERLGKTQTGLGIELGALYDIPPMSQSTISKWESGEKIPPLDQFIDLSKVFHCDIAYLLGESDDRRVGNTDVSEYTGLNPETTERLHNELATDTEAFFMRSFFTLLIDTLKFDMLKEDFDNLMIVVGEFAQMNAYSTSEDVRRRVKGQPQLIREGTVKLSTGDAIRFLEEKVLGELHRAGKEAMELLALTVFKSTIDDTIKSRPGATNTETANDQD